MTENIKTFRIFLSHAKEDIREVRAIYKKLRMDGYNVWLDEANLLGGQSWEYEIRKAVKESDIVIVCLSKIFNSQGYKQKEVRIAIEQAELQPEGTIYVIPTRLEECEVMESLKKWHWIDFFSEDGYEKLRQSLDFQQASQQKTQDIFFSERAKLKVEKKEFTEAIEDYSQAVNINPWNAEYFRLRGECFIKIHDYDRALADYTRAIELNPDNPEYYYERGNAYLGRERYSPEFVLKIVKSFASIFFKTSTTPDFETIDTRKAKQDLSKAKSLDPTNLKYEIHF